MSTLVTRRPLRIFCDLGSSDHLVEQASGSAPVIARGSPTVFQLALGRYGLVFSAVASQIASLTVQVRDGAAAGSGVRMEKTIASGFVDTLTQATWQDRTAQHCEVGFTAAECNVQPGDYWLALWFTTAGGEQVTLGYGPLSIIEDGAGAAGSPPVLDPLYYTKTEIDALFARLVPANSLYRIKVDGTGVYFQLKDNGTGGWRTVWFQNGVLQAGPSEA